jgi:hypothetical protein
VSDVYALVRSLRDNQLPRNRFFDVHATPSGQAARRLLRFLRAVERDILNADRVIVRAREEGGIAVELSFAAVRFSRRVMLTAAEHALLVEDARLAARLQTSL